MNVENNNQIEFWGMGRDGCFMLVCCYTKNDKEKKTKPNAIQKNLTLI